MITLLKWSAFAFGCSVAVVALALIVGNWRWRSRTAELTQRLEGARASQPAAVATGDDAALPEPVRRYFRLTLGEGATSVAAVTMTHDGTFNMGETGDVWRPFTSRQRTVIERPGFLWDARVSVVPGVTARAHDAYIAGEGILHVAIAGLATVADVQDQEGEAARGELMRFLAEAPWYPTALLPSERVRWTAIDAGQARVELVDGPVRVALTYSFGADGLVESVRSEARGRTVGGAIVQTPWAGRWFDYERRDGMLVPTRGEVAWLLPEGPKVYWRGRLTSIEYDLAK